MATQKSTESARAASVNNPTKPERIAFAPHIEDLANEAMALNHLVDWCVEAFDFVDRIQEVASHDEELAAALRTLDLRFPVRHGRKTGEGMSFVLQHQGSLLSQMASCGVRS